LFSSPVVLKNCFLFLFRTTFQITSLSLYYPAEPDLDG